MAPIEPATVYIGLLAIIVGMMAAIVWLLDRIDTLRGIIRLRSPEFMQSGRCPVCGHKPAGGAP